MFCLDCPMENVKKINEDISIATNQPSSEQFDQAEKAGFKSVLNLRDSQEEGVLEAESQQVEAAGLTYANIAVKLSEMDEALVDEVLAKIEQLPKPVLAHCKSGLRSGAIALIYDAVKHNKNAQAALDEGKTSGFDCDAHPQMKQFFVSYINQHSKT